MKRLMHKFFFTGTVVLTAGAVGVVTGIGRLLQNQPRSGKESGGVSGEPASNSAEALAATSLKTARHFTIKRTKSEVGYVYWILEGHGKYKCFVLCDSWDDAVAQAKARLAEGGGETPSETDMSLTVQS